MREGCRISTFALMYFMGFSLIAKDGQCQAEDARLILADEHLDRILVPGDALSDESVGFGHTFYEINAREFENLHEILGITILRIAN